MDQSLGCNEEKALEFMGCSKTMFEQLKKRHIVIPVRKGWYSYNLLRRAMEMLEREALAKFAPEQTFPESTQEIRPKGAKPSTAELLARMGKK